MLHDEPRLIGNVNTAAGRSQGRKLEKKRENCGNESLNKYWIKAVLFCLLSAGGADSCGGGTAMWRRGGVALHLLTCLHPSPACTHTRDAERKIEKGETVGKEI